MLKDKKGFSYFVSGCRFIRKPALTYQNRNILLKLWWMLEKVTKHSHYATSVGPAIIEIETIVSYIILLSINLVA